MSMRSKERQARLLEALKLGEIDVDDLARRFDVSASTVRRDLQHLSDTRGRPPDLWRRDPRRAPGRDDLGPSGSP